MLIRAGGAEPSRFSRPWQPACRLSLAMEGRTLPSAQPLVSVITPAYNRADYLEEVIQSVLAQDYPNIEYIVLDDGSTDGTAAIIDRHRGQIRAETHTNMGETQTVNRGFALASGAIVGVINSDDPLLPGAISKSVETFAADPRLIVTYPDWNMIDAHGTLIRTVRPPDYDYVDMLRWHHCLPGPGAFFRKEVADRLGGRDARFRYIADFDFWLRAGLIGPFAHIPEVLATFRNHPSGASSASRGRRMAQEHLDLVRKIYALPDLPAPARAVRREAFSSAYYVGGAVSSSRSSMLKKKLYVQAMLYRPTKYAAEYRGRMGPIKRELRHGWRRHFKSLLRTLTG